MGTAAVISLEEFRQRRARAEARQELHKRFDRWLDAVEEQVPEKAPTLEQVTQVVFEMRQELTGMIVETLVRQRHSETLEQQTMPCPNCGRLLRARGSSHRTVETMVGDVSLARPYFYCVRCERGFFPLDEALQLSERRKQWDMQKAAVSLAAEVPYETGSELFGDLTGLAFSDHIMHEAVGEVADGLAVLSVSPRAEEIEQKVAQVAEGRKWRPILVLAIDGADVPTRPESAKGRRPGRKKKRAKRARWKGQWREAKGFRFYLVDRKRIVHLLSWHQVQSDKDLGEALRQVPVLAEGQGRKQA
jgi:hypothetical protein